MRPEALSGPGRTDVAKQGSEQKKTVKRVMHEWKRGELESSRGGKVRNRRQAVQLR
jgi:hypothetical protein